MAKILPPVSQGRADQAWLQATRERHVATAAAFGLLAMPDARDNAMRILGGRMWQRMHLWATTQGLAMLPHRWRRPAGTDALPRRLSTHRRGNEPPP